MRRTKAQLLVAEALLGDPGGRHYGYDLGRRAGVRSGVLYPMLNRWFELGWLTDGWENPAEVVGRPPRRFYELTDEGRRGLVELLGAVPGGSLPVRRVGWGTTS